MLEAVFIFVFICGGWGLCGLCDLHNLLGQDLALHFGYVFSGMAGFGDLGWGQQVEEGLPGRRNKGPPMMSLLVQEDRYPIFRRWLHVQKVQTLVIAIIECLGNAAHQITGSKAQCQCQV